jgi:hypothetical protein
MKPEHTVEMRKMRYDVNKISVGKSEGKNPL